MTARRRLSGLVALLAMLHLIVAGTAFVCAPPHTDFAPGSSHSRETSTDRASGFPCCAALASCAATTLGARTVAMVVFAPRGALVSATSERAPRADSPAPELPPPRA